MRRLELLDYGRFFAAVMVVLYHYTFNGILGGKIDSIEHIPLLIGITKYGYLGVEFFFMISGYVIFFSAKHRTTPQFAVSRAIRLYPSYWFAVIFTSLFAFSWGGDLMSVSLPQIAVNLTLLQNYVGVGNVDGVYWTLFYEVKFYALVSLVLLFGLQKKLNFLFIAWPFVMAAALLLGYDHLPYLGGYFSYFSAGALFALLKDNKTWGSAASLLLAFVLCLKFSTGMAILESESTGFGFSEYVVALIITCFFVFFFVQSAARVQMLRLPWSRLLGALTYPVYLIHAHFGYMVINKFATEENKVVIYLITSLVVLFIAYLMHRFIEVALATFWKKVFMETLYKVVSMLQKFIRRAFSLVPRRAHM